MPKENTLNLDDNMICGLSYVAMPVFSLILYFALKDKSEIVDFHIKQSISFGIAIFILGFLVNQLPFKFDFFYDGNIIYWLVAIIMAFKAYNLEKFEIPLINKVTKLIFTK
jgi:uncharacterized membrane protein